MSQSSQPPQVASGGHASGPQSLNMQGKRHGEVSAEVYNNALQYTKRIRQLVAKSQPFNQVDGDTIRTQLAVRQLEEQAKLLDSTYNEFEKLAKSLPSTTPINNTIPSLAPLAKYTYEADSDLLTNLNFNSAYEEYACTNYTNCFSLMLKEFMSKLLVQQRSSKFEIQPPLPDFDVHSNIKSQKLFEKGLREYIAEHNKKSQKLPGAHKMECFYLERNSTQCILELRMVMIPNRTAIKLLILVNNGNIDYMNIYGVSEDFVYLDDNKRKVDVYSPSKCEMHEQWSRLLNSNYQQFINNNRSAEISLKLQFIFSVLSKLNIVYSSVCRVCKELLKNGTLPVVLDIRSRNIAHEDCRWFV